MPSNVVDKETLQRYRIVKPVKRPDQPAPHPNPVRRFREDLQLTREAFAALLHVPVETERAWEREGGAVMPKGSRALRLIDLARRNWYPLMLEDIWKYTEKSRR
jgi:DNA-binding transcriptional regulator YiaG